MVPPNQKYSVIVKFARQSVLAASAMRSVRQFAQDPLRRVARLHRRNRDTKRPVGAARFAPMPPGSLRQQCAAVAVVEDAHTAGS